VKFAFFHSKKNKDTPPTRLERGAEGEKFALRVLKKAHYKILEQNFRTPVGEIDIVARDRDFLVFVEVRTKSSIEFGLPQETILKRKKERLCKAARWYLQKNRLDDAPCRFDVVAVVTNDGKKNPEFEIIKEAFRPEK
jgi:putative endonuclease